MKLNTLLRRRCQPLYVGALALAGGLSALSLGIAVQYGWDVGSSTGLSTGVLLVSLGLLTELGKSLGFYASVVQGRARKVLPALGWSAVALSCLTYSVVADLHVSATTRGDASAKRDHKAQILKDAMFSREDAGLRLKALKTGAHYDTEIAKLLATPGANRCLKVDGPISKSTCKQVDALRLEKAATARRVRDLEAKIAKADEILRTRDDKQVVGSADASASVFAALAGRIGWKLDASDTALALTLLPVLIIEFGGSLAWILAASFSTVPGRVPTSISSVPAVSQKGDDDQGPGAQVLAFVRDNGGHVKTGQRALAKFLEVSKSEVNRILADLSEAGKLVVNADRSGTELRLATA